MDCVERPLRRSRLSGALVSHPGTATTDFELPLGAVLRFRRRVLWLLDMSLGLLGSWRFGRSLLALL